MAEDLVKLTEEDPDLRIVFKEFPVFGTESTLAARAALAAAKQGKYAEFHVAIMGFRGAPFRNSNIPPRRPIGVERRALAERHAI